MHLQRYVLALLSVGGATGALLVLERFGFRPPTGMVMLLSVAISSWYGKRGPALLSLILALPCMLYFFVEPRFSFRLEISQLPYFISFTLFALLLFSFSTVRRRIEADLRQTRDKLKVEVEERSSLLELTHDSIFVRDMNSIITYWNRGAEEFYGWTKKQAIGEQPGALLHTVFPKAFEEILEELLRTDRWEGELTHTKADGVQVIVASRWSLRRDQQGRPVAILETGNDITGRKHWEEEIQALNQELAKRSTALEASNKELEAFAYSVSHDLRAPLRHMAGYAELLQQNASSVLDEKSRRYMTMILDSAKRMGTLIDDLLAFSRVGRADIQKTTVSLEQVVKEALSEVRQETDGRNIVWRIGALPDVFGDRSLLRLVLVNLISNAVKFTRTCAQAEIEIGSATGKKDEIVVFIRDNGVGFDMKYANKLFGVFQRLHRTEEFEGTGIGLATVQRIINRHGGRAWAEGLVDQGSTFYFSVPRITGGISYG